MLLPVPPESSEFLFIQTPAEDVESDHACAALSMVRVAAGKTVLSMWTMNVSVVQHSQAQHQSRLVLSPCASSCILRVYEPVLACLGFLLPSNPCKREQGCLALAQETWNRTSFVMILGNIRATVEVLKGRPQRSNILMKFSTCSFYTAVTPMPPFTILGT